MSDQLITQPDEEPVGRLILRIVEPVGKVDVDPSRADRAKEVADQRMISGVADFYPGRRAAGRKRKLDFPR